MSKWLTGPGLFRLVLALIVFGSHLSRFALGTMAVEVFFFLSGYWICVMWRNKYARARQPYLTYLASRIARLLPTFILASGLLIGFSLLNGISIQTLRAGASPWHFVASHLLLLGYASFTYPALPPAWSLDLEMQFYILAPALIWAATRGDGRVRWLLVGATAALGLASALTLGPRALPSYLVFFVLGMTASVSKWRPSAQFAWGGVLLGALAVLLLLASPLRETLLKTPHPGPLFAYNLAANVALSFFLMPFALYTTGRKGTSKDAMFGDLSYIVYLLHWIGIVWIGLHIQEWRSGGERAVMTAAMTAVLFTVCWLVWFLFDRPINRLRARWVDQRLRGGAREDALPERSRKAA